MYSSNYGVRDALLDNNFSLIEVIKNSCKLLIKKKKKITPTKLLKLIKDNKIACDYTAETLCQGLQSKSVVSPTSTVMAMT